jgi:hypothetical protein
MFSADLLLLSAVMPAAAAPAGASPFAKMIADNIWPSLQPLLTDKYAAR